MEKAICREERRLFLNEWRHNPAQLGTLAPITVKLADAVASLIPHPHEARVVEIGAGTGRLTRAILRAGVHHNNLVAVELNGRLCRFLRQCWQGDAPHIVEGNAMNLTNIIPPEFVGSTTMVVSAIPFRYITQQVRAQIMQAAAGVLATDGSMLQVTYHPVSPIPPHLNWSSKRRVSLLWNLPPAFVFEFIPGSA